MRVYIRWPTHIIIICTRKPKKKNKWTNVKLERDVLYATWKKNGSSQVSSNISTKKNRESEWWSWVGYLLKRIYMQCYTMAKPLICPLDFQKILQNQWPRLYMFSNKTCKLWEPDRTPLMLLYSSIYHMKWCCSQVHWELGRVCLIKLAIIII